MVESLQTNLDQQLDLLESLTNVVAQEQQLLCSGRIQGWVLQGVTEQKVQYWQPWPIWIRPG
ncbi:conserved domain protein [Yersinia pestis KIM D27]|nr:conserved domain protein [Yersinia pestis KIM D27]